MSSTLLRSKAGDIISEYDGRKVERVSDLPRPVAVTPVGRDVLFAWPLPDRHRLTDQIQRARRRRRGAGGPPAALRSR